MLGAPTLVTGSDAQGPVFVQRIDFAGDDNYPTGGTTLFNAFVRALFKDQRSVISVFGNDGTNEYEYDNANDTLIARVMATGVEVVNAANLAGATVKLTVLSK